MKPEETQETVYVGIDTGLPPYLPYPRFLLKMDISHTAKLLYALLLDRTTLSQKNGWQDGEGRTFIVYPVAEIADMLDSVERLFVCAQGDNAEHQRHHHIQGYGLDCPQAEIFSRHQDSPCHHPNPMG